MVLRLHQYNINSNSNTNRSSILVILMTYGDLYRDDHAQERGPTEQPVRALHMHGAGVALLLLYCLWSGGAD